MILTTSVGGLGLTLTGADVVIFLEHDWNPMRDLQAMDRAHRLGQTRTVNVYRLIVRNTIEDSIMNLQRFKQNLAKNLVQARPQGEELTKSEGNELDLNDLLKSFEEHTSYKAATTATSPVGFED
jgi:TATA-binding protein-associated factor